MGYRLATYEGGPLDKDSGRQELQERSVQDAFVTRQVTNWDIAQGWSGVTQSGTTITDADQDVIADNLWTWLVAVKALFSSQFILDSVRLYPVGVDGRSKTAPSIYTPRATTPDPTGTTMLPPDVSVAISHGTATRGPKGRGRVFMGAPVATIIDGAGAITSAHRTTLVNATVSLMNAWRGMSSGAGDLSFTPVVWHRVGDVAGVEDGKFGSPIRLVRVDDRCDTQRRRDRQVTRNWTTTQLT